MEHHAAGQGHHTGHNHDEHMEDKRKTMDFLQAVFTRRSVRKFLDKDVEWDKVTTILMAGHSAPSSGNIQNWLFCVVRDDDKRKKIAEACMQQYWMQDAKVHIVVCGDNVKAKRLYGARGETFYTIQNCAAAIENMLLAATALGLGSCWVTAFEEGMLRRILDVPESMTVHGVITIGYASEIPEPQPGMRIEHVTRLETCSGTGVIKMPYWVMGWYREAWPKIGKAAKKTGKRLHERIKGRINEFREKLRKKSR